MIDTDMLIRLCAPERPAVATPGREPGTGVTAALAGAHAAWARRHYPTGHPLRPDAASSS